MKLLILTAILFSSFAFGQTATPPSINPGGSSHKHVMMNIYGTNSDEVSSYGIVQAGRYKSTSAVNAIRVTVSSGTFSGDGQMYGYGR